jgi:hypothetical protein
MCYYSLGEITNRLAVEGEELVVHRFPTGSKGLASPYSPISRWWLAEQVPAVCVPPGARLVLQDVPQRTQQELGLQATEEVTFVQLSAEAFQHRDAVRFGNGRHISLQELPEGVRVRVLKLSLAEVTEPAVGESSPAFVARR